MTLIEAIKSGKRFRKINDQGEKRWQAIGPIDHSCGIVFRVEDILSEWEIEEEKIEISKNQLALILTNKTIGSLAEIYKELGFKS